MQNFKDRNKKRQQAGVKTITESEIIKIQEYYDEGHSLRKCQLEYGYSRETLIKYLKTRHKKQTLQRAKAVVEWKLRTKRKLAELKGGKCILCGYNKYIGNLVFHHIDPNKKEFTISGKSIAFEKLKLEAEKCILLCHNCHGEVHCGLVSV